MIGDNAIVGTSRSVFNATTKVTSAPRPFLNGVSCFMSERGKTKHVEGFAVEYDAQMSFEANLDVIENDYVTGWNPQNLVPAPQYIVKRTEYHVGGLGAHKVAYLDVYRG